MSKIVRKYRFIDGWRIGENESWFSDMAAAGLHLKGLGPLFARFERGRPEDIRYRIDFMYRASATDEQLGFYEDCGWEFVCAQKDMRVFRSAEALGAPEPHTDPAEQAYTLEKLKRRLISSGIICALLYAAAICMTCFALFLGGTPVLNLVNNGSYNMLFNGMLCVYSGALIVHSAVSVSKLVRSMREGRAVNHRANWRKYRRFSYALLLILSLFAVFVIVLPLASMALRHTETLPLMKTDQSIVRLADIESNPALEREETTVIRGVEWGNSVTYEWSPLAPVMLEVRESGKVPGRLWPDGSGEYSPSINCRIYRLQFSWMADSLLMDLCKRFGDYDIIPITETMRTGFDRLLIRDGDMRREVFAHKGRMIIHVTYYGGQDIEAVIQAVSEALV